MGETLVLVEKENHALAFYDVALDAPPDRVALPTFPHELVVDHDRGYALVSHYGALSSLHNGTGGHAVVVVDCWRRRVVNMLDCRPHGRIHGVTQDEAGRVYALSEAAARLLVFASARDKGPPAATIPTGGLKSHMLAVCGDGRAAFATNLGSGTVTKLFPSEPCRDPVALPTGFRPEGLCLSADERRLFVTHRGSNTVVALATNPFAVERVAPVRPDPLRIYRVGSDRLLVIFHEGRGVSLMSGDLAREIAFLPLPGRPTAACVSPDGTRAFVSVGPASSVELDLTTFAPRAMRSTGLGPDACQVLPEAGQQRT